MKLSITTSLLITVLLAANQANAADATPEQVIAGIDARNDQMFRAESGGPLVRAEIGKPLSPGRGNFSRHYSWSLVAFASRCLYLDEMIDEANGALAENAQHYLDNPLDINDRDSFHWHAEMVMRLIEMYGSNGTKRVGRITKENEALLLRPIWLYVKQSSRLEKAEYKESKTWYYYSSENHHFMDLTVNWHFAKLAKDRPEYKELKCDAGGSLAEHYRAWNEYFLVYCVERARKSLCAEMMCGHYNSVLIKGFYNFYDFGDPQVRRSAGMLLDLYWAYWAQEQIGGVQGGGQSRVSLHEALQGNIEHGTAPLAWLYFGIGDQPVVHGQDMDAALSDYRPPAVVADIALDVAGRGRYEVRQRPQGLGGRVPSSSNAAHRAMATSKKPPTKLRTDGGGILRYSYCDPAFIIGCPMTEARPVSDWAPISMQGRWQGVIFAGTDDARIVPIVRPANNIRALNTQWCVQSKGTLITQKLKYHKGGAEMMVWISKAGLSEPVVEDGIVFVESSGAYAAIRVAIGDFQCKDNIYTINKPEGIVYQTRPGRTIIPNEEYSPVILEVMAKGDIDTFDAFKAKVKACKLSTDSSVLKYETIYGDVLTLDTLYKKTPTINGRPVNYAPSKVFASPFLNADYNSGIVTITKGERQKVLNFND